MRREFRTLISWYLHLHVLNNSGNKSKGTLWVRVRWSTWPVLNHPVFPWSYEHLSRLHLLIINPKVFSEQQKGTGLAVPIPFEPPAEGSTYLCMATDRGQSANVTRHQSRPPTGPPNQQHLAKWSWDLTSLHLKQKITHLLSMWVKRHTHTETGTHTRRQTHTDTRLPTFLK